MSSPYTVHIAPSMSEIDAAQWDACANPEANTPAPGQAVAPDDPYEAERFNPFIIACVPAGARNLQIGWAANRLDQHAYSRQGFERPSRRRRAGLSENAFHGRICLRSWLGRCLSTGGAALLSEAPGRRSFHAGDRPAAARAPGHGEAARMSSLRGPSRLARQNRSLVDPHHLPDALRMGDARRQRLPAAHRPAVPFHQPGLRGFRRLPGRSRVAQAQDDPARAQGGAGGRHQIELLTGADIREVHWDAFFRFLHGYRRAQMGHALSDARIFLSASARR